MATSVVPALIDALVAQAQAALPAVDVYDGVGVSDDAGDYLMIGVDDPDNLDESEAASITQDQIAFGSTRPRMENGAIHVSARSVSGEVGVTGQKAARDAVYAIQEALAAVLRTTSDLGVTGVLKIGNGSNLRLLQNQDAYGARATLLYDISFEAQI
jgi:hypothetical protein